MPKVTKQIVTELAFKPRQSGSRAHTYNCYSVQTHTQKQRRAKQALSELEH